MECYYFYSEWSFFTYLPLLAMQLFTSLKNMDRSDLFKKCKRAVEPHLTKKTLFFTLIIFGLLVYFGPGVLRWFFPPPSIEHESLEECLDIRLTSFYKESLEFDANIRHSPLRGEEHNYLPYVGNGYIGVAIEEGSRLMVRNNRALTYPVPYMPLVNLATRHTLREATVVHYPDGIAYRFMCFGHGAYGIVQVYAHRTLPSLLVQEVKIVNPTNSPFTVHLSLDEDQWHTSTSKHIEDTMPFTLRSGTIYDESLDNKVVAVFIATGDFPSSIEVNPYSSSSYTILTAVSYTPAISPIEFEENAKRSENELKQVLYHAHEFKNHNLVKAHKAVWNHLWSTGFSISYSLAAGAINGHVVNATMYVVMSQIRSPYHEDNALPDVKREVSRSLAYTEGCYGSHHTLQADSLWQDLSTLKGINALVVLWFLTLEKQGCHNLVKAGALGVVQAMVLSIGGLRFSNQHLEFNMHPRELHRDFTFRRLSYGNATHMNVSVEVQDDNRAVIYVALDRSDKNYYACDGGCLDKAVQLGPQRIQFPVKLTEPVTAILYVTYDLQHMEDLKHTIHVKQISEAPALEHHVIALHKHGHHLGGLPALFWVSIGLLIVIFHLFLFKLIYNEYWSTPDKFRNRYGKW